MKAARLTLPEISLMAGTRVAFGAGIALLLGEKVTRERRSAIGWTLFMVGAATTIPLMRNVLGKLE